MVIFISGSINSGKTTTAKALASKLNAEFIDIDDLNDRVPNFDLAKDIAKGITIAIDEINQLTRQGKSVVLSYVIREEDRQQLLAGLDDKQPVFVTLAPRIEVAQSDRGRGLTDWEKDRIKYHYDTGIATPSFGAVIDNSEMTVDEVVQYIMNNKHSPQATVSDHSRPIPHDSRYIPLTQQPNCCVPTCIQMVMYRNGIPLRPAEEIGYHLGLVVSSGTSNLFYNVRTADQAPSAAGYGIQSHLPQYEPNAAFARMDIPLKFSIEPITDFSSADDLLDRLRMHESSDHDVLVAFNLGALLNDQTLERAHHACVFDRIVDGRIRLIDPSVHAAKWKTVDVEQLSIAMQQHVSPEWGGIWLLTKTTASD